MRGPELTVTDLVDWIEALASLSAEAEDAERVDRIRALENLKGAIAAAQAREAAALKRSVVAAEAARGVPAAQRGRGVAAQVALARRESPHRGVRLVGLAEALVKELPHTMAALTRGEISEWRATLVCRETACLSRVDRLEVDRLIAAGLPLLSDRQVVAVTRRQGYRLDPHSVVARYAQAEADRRVTIRPAPDAMAVISALLPVAQGVAAYGALVRVADSARAAGDQRGRGQVMADTLVTRLTGSRMPDQVPVELQLVLSETTLWGRSSEPALIPGYGPVPADWARQLLARLRASTPAWVRRLYVRPTTGQLVAMESNRRLFPEGMRRFLVARDQYCRTPWCGAPIRHADHVVPARAGGPTAISNGQGLCEACNQAKEAGGWSSAVTAEAVVTTTGTGHSYRSKAPPLVEGRRRIQIDIQVPPLAPAA